MKRACMSNVKDPENRSKKKCCCGGHSLGAKKPRSKNHRTNKAEVLEALDKEESSRLPI